MRFSTLSEISTDVILLLSQVPGTNSQVYSEPQIKAKIQDHFDLVFDEGWWDSFTGVLTGVATDVTTGLPTTDFSVNPIVNWLGDIQYIWNENRVKPITRLPQNIRESEITGSGARFFVSHPTAAALFKILPITNTDTLEIKYRTRPLTYTDGQTIQFDAVYLKFITAWDYITADGNNPGEAEKYQRLAAARLEQLKSMQTQHPIAVGGQETGIPNEWYTVQ